MGITIPKKLPKKRHDFTMSHDGAGTVAIDGTALLIGKKEKLIVDGQEYDIQFDSVGQAELKFEQSKCFHFIRLKTKGQFKSDRRLAFYW